MAYYFISEVKPTLFYSASSIIIVLDFMVPSNVYPNQYYLYKLGGFDWVDTSKRWIL